MLGTFAVSWFGFAFLCWLALRQVTISDSEVALALMEIVYWSAVTVFSNNQLQTGVREVKKEEPIG